MMDAIGGYFELELRKGEHYHKDALRFNTARNCFEYILRARKYEKVFIPYYTCEVLLEPIKKLNINYEFYHINESLEPASDFYLKNNEGFLYTNYFGLKQICVEKLAKKYGKRLIVDNAQAFYEKPIQGIDTFYSPRKFFGVSDGGYLYIDTYLHDEFEKDTSYDRMLHLLKRADVSAEFGFEDFHKDDSSLDNQPIMMMSDLTSKSLYSIDYELIKKVRIENYLYLSKQLSSRNKLHLQLSDGAVPMIYPYLTNQEGLRKRLIDNKVYVAKYWPNVTEWCENEKLECFLCNNVMALPIDQRYAKCDMRHIINLINEYNG